MSEQSIGVVTPSTAPKAKAARGALYDIYLPRLICGVVILLAWEFIVRAGAPAYVAKPSTVILAIPRVIVDPTFLKATGATLWAVAEGLGITLVFGTVIGVVMGRSLNFDRAIRHYINGFNAIPMIIVLPLFSLWFGYSSNTRIATITGPPDTPGGRYRLVGFQEELGELFDLALVETGDYTTESGADAMQRLLDRAPDIDAVFAASDLMAAGAMATLRRNGKRVPEDVAVAGFDDSGLAATLEPPLTTMRQPFDKVSDSMVEVLLHVIDGKEPPSVVLPTSLVVRQST